MTEDLSNMAFSGSLTDPEEIEWQFSLGRTALDPVSGSHYQGLSAVEACLALLCGLHAKEADAPTPTEERSLRMLVEDALGSSNFQGKILPSLVARAIAAENSALVAILLSYAEDEHAVLALANGEEGSSSGAEAGRAAGAMSGDGQQAPGA